MLCIHADSTEHRRLQLCTCNDIYKTAMTTSIVDQQVGEPTSRASQ